MMRIAFQWQAGSSRKKKQGDTVINIIKTPRGRFAGTLGDIEAYIADREREHNNQIENLMAGYSALQEEYAEVKARCDAKGADSEEAA